MKYAPGITSARTKGLVEVGGHTAALLTDIVSVGPVEYLYVVAVFPGDSLDPCFYVASEVNKMAKQFGSGSHFLGLFDGDGHLNRGASDDWADEEKFFAEALRIIKETFGGNE